VSKDETSASSAAGEIIAAYTVEQVAELLQVSRISAYEAVHRAQIPSIRIGRLIRIPRKALDEWLLQTAHNQTLNTLGRLAKNPNCPACGSRLDEGESSVLVPSEQITSLAEDPALP
jgi:excisionase family DNA binding protein